jgi:hypothetical protein
MNANLRRGYIQEATDWAIHGFQLGSHKGGTDKFRLDVSLNCSPHQAKDATNVMVTKALERRNIELSIPPC